MMDLRLFGAVGAAVVLGSPALAQEVVGIPGGDRRLVPAVAEEYRVGSLAGADWETFANVRTVDFDAEGNLYILDAGNHRVVVVDRIGELVRQFGTEGDGPGELRRPVGMVVAPDGTVGVMDFGHQAFVVYDAGGDFVRNARNEYRTGIQSSAVEYHPRHGVVGTLSGFNFNFGDEDRDPSAPIRFVPFEESAEIEELGRAWRPAPAAGGGGAQRLSGGGGRVSFSTGQRMMAFTPNLRTEVLPDGRIVVADTAAYQLRLIDGEGGGVARLLRRPSVRPRPVGEAEREAERERRIAVIEAAAAEGGGGAVFVRTTGGASGGGGSSSMSIDPEQMREMEMQRLKDMGFHDLIPTIEDVRVDAGGRIWVGRTGEPFGESGPIDVVTADGAYLGTVRPGSFELPVVFGPDGLAAWIETDEFDVEYVVVRRVSGVR